MSSADTLRGMAKAFMMAGSHERADTCLAGADALDTLEKVRAAVGRIADAATAAGHPLATDYSDGIHFGLTLARDLVLDALGDTP